MRFLGVSGTTHHSRSLASALALVTAAAIPGAGWAIGFEERTAAAGLSEFASETWGATVGDLNGDGLLDIYVSNHVKAGAMLRNNGDGTLTDVTRVVDPTRLWHTDFPREVEDHTHTARWGDYDNDGDLDIGAADEVLTWAYENRDGRMYPSGIPKYIHWRLSAAWIDLNQDGWLDLGLAGVPSNNDRRNPGLVQNNQDGTFSPTYLASGTPPFECTFNNLVLSDYNVDGQMDFACGLYPNQWAQGGQFYTIGSLATGPLPEVTQVQDVLSADLNGDLRPDLVMTRGALRPSDTLQDSPTRVGIHMTASNNTQRVAEIRTTGVLELWVDWNRGDTQHRTCLPMYLGAGGAVTDGNDRTDRNGRFELFSLTLDPADPQWHGLYDYNGGCGAALGYFPAEGLWRLQLGGSSSHHIFVQAESDAGISAEVLAAGAHHLPMRPKYFANLPAGFEDQSLAAGLELEQCASVLAADLDNDMDQDLYFACRSGAGNKANVVYENDGTGRFTKLVNHGAEGEVGISAREDGTGAGNADSAVFLDYDLDGYLDLFVVNGLNLRPSVSAGGYNLLRNTGQGHHWIQLDLEGTSSNRDGLGARIYATTPDGTVQLREQNGGYHRWSQNQMRIHFGLAQHTSVDLRIEWPSGQQDLITNVAVNGLYRVTEGSGQATPRTITAPLPHPCVEPSISGATDKGLFLWQNCVYDRWHVRTVSPERDEAFSGRLSLASGSISDLNRIQLEGVDSLTQIDSRTLEFDFSVSAGNVDGFSFVLDAPVGACFDFTSYAGNTMYVGGDKRPVDGGTGLELDPVRLCPALLGPDADGDGTPDTADAFPQDPREDRDRDGDGIGDRSDPFPDDPTNNQNLGDQCGAPTISNSADRGTFLWQDCTGPAQTWHLRVTGGGTTQSLIYDSTLSPGASITNLGQVSIEASDQIDPGNSVDPLRYVLRIWGNGIDGLDFSAAAGVCFTPGRPGDLPVWLGANRVPLTDASYALDGISQCADPGAMDSDGDGLIDAAELSLGTDPNNPDSDGERLLDGEEVNVYGTDPLRANTDRDGLSDYAEVTFFGTDPLNADTDGDTLSDGDERKVHGTDPLKGDTDGGGTDDGTEVGRGSDPLNPADD